VLIFGRESIERGNRQVAGMAGFLSS